MRGGFRTIEIAYAPGRSNKTMGPSLEIQTGRYKDSTSALRYRAQLSPAARDYRFVSNRACFNNGSTIGSGECVRKSGPASNITGHVTGYIRVKAKDLSHAKQLLGGNPVFEAGGTVEIRELPYE